MYEIKVIEEFSGAHNLRNYKGKCESLHGHNWKVEAVLYSVSVNGDGMVLDFKDFRDKLKAVLSPMDHKYLNDIAFFKKENPTSENIARYIHRNLAPAVGKKLKVSVWETGNSCASFKD